jgi:protein disulfide-isomerase-like protein
MKLISLLVAVMAHSALAIELTPDNWEAKTAGKTVFLKMYAPWCGHCKRLKPHWDKLMAEYDGHATVLVADVDCTAGGKPICDQNGVRGFPTVKHGDPANLEDYQGGREFADIQAFAKTLKPLCSPFALDLCEGDQKAKIEELMAMDVETLSTKVAEADDKIEAAEKNFKDEVSKLQKKYESLMEDKDATIEAIKAEGLGMMRSVVAFNAAKK